MILFGLVPLELRTLACMGFHYVFLVGLALWDSAAQTSREVQATSAGRILLRDGEWTVLLPMRPCGTMSKQLNLISIHLVIALVLN